MDYSVCNDEELIREYQSTHNQQIMAILFTRYTDIGFRTAMRFVRNQADAEDILQTTYIHFLQNIGMFREGITIRPWLMKMIVNTCKNKLIEEKRRQKRQEKVASERFVQHVPEAQNSKLESEKVELKELLRKNVDLLPEKYRSPIWLVLFEEVSYSEVATVLELPEKTIRTQVARGLEKLRQALSSYGSILSISAILDLIKETTLEKAPSSVNHLISSPEIYQLAVNSAKQTSLVTLHNPYYSFKFIAIVGIATVIGIFSFLFIRNNFISKTPIKAMTLKKEFSEQIPMHLSLDFNRKSDIAPYEFLGSYNYLSNGGLDNSGCIEITDQLFFRFSVENIKLPLKMTYRLNLVSREKIAGYSLVTWGHWEKISLINGMSKIEMKNGEIGKYLFTQDEDWFYVTIWITENSIDIWGSGSRRDVYLYEHNDANKYLYLHLIDESKIDNLLIESVEKVSVPDVSFFQKINEEIYRESKEEITLISKYFPQSTKEGMMPKHRRFGPHSEKEFIDVIKNTIKEK